MKLLDSDFLLEGEPVCDAYTAFFFGCHLPMSPFLKVVVYKAIPDKVLPKLPDTFGILWCRTVPEDTDSPSRLRDLRLRKDVWGIYDVARLAARKISALPYVDFYISVLGSSAFHLFWNVVKKLTASVPFVAVIYWFFLFHRSWFFKLLFYQ